MKNVDLAAEVDTRINVVWDGTGGVLPRVEKQLECGWKVGLLDVTC
jgi:hypothetical protein